MLQAFIAGLTGSLQTNGYLKISIADSERGMVARIILWGFHPLAQVSISHDTQYTVNWPIRFPTAILVPPFGANFYYRTNLVVSTVLYSVEWRDVRARRTGFGCGAGGQGLGPEITNGFSWLAIDP